MTPTPSIGLAKNRRTSAFERRVAAALARHVDAAAPIVVACSGGPDSLATLVAVARSRPPALVIAAHFDHRLRPPAQVAGERVIVESAAASLGVTFLAGRAARVPTDHGEAAARTARYRWLAAACRSAGAQWCATGHTLDDQAETVLLRLARGTGLRGAAGMEEGAPWPIAMRGAPTLVRPVLGISRVEVEAYVHALGAEAARDPSNDTLDYARNRVRQRVLPELRALNPRAAEQIAAFAARARADDDALNAWARAALDEIGECTPARVAVRRAPLLALPPAVATRVLRDAAAHVGVAVEAEQLAALVHAARARARVVALGGTVEAALEGDSLVLRTAAANS